MTFQTSRSTSSGLVCCRFSMNEDLADDQPVEQHADRSETQFGGRLGGAIHDLGSMDVPRGLGRD